MITTEAVGWLAAALTLATFSMKTMIWLRAIAIGSNIAFISFGFLAEQHPILLLHSILLPFNAFRLRQAFQVREYARQFALDDFDLRWIQDVSSPKTFKKGAKIFSRGDDPDHFYFIVTGKVLVADAKAILRDSEVFGEIAFLTQQGQRTSDVIALSDTTTLAVGREAFRELMRTNPAFGAHICRLVADRLTPRVRSQKDRHDKKAARAEARPSRLKDASGPAPGAPIACVAPAGVFHPRTTTNSPGIR